MIEPVSPSGLRCLECGYRLDGLPLGTCPECGNDGGPDDVVLWRRRAAAAARIRGLAGRWSAFWVCVIAVLSVGAGLFDGSISMVPRAGVALGAAVGGSIGVGLALLGMARPWNRARIAQLWIGDLWILHAPWLVMPGCAAIAVLAAAWDGPGGGTLATVSTLGLLGWLLGCLTAWAIWLFCWNEALHKERLGGTWMALAGSLAATLAMAASGYLGLMGGMLVVEGAARWTDGRMFGDS